jgi:hypothetical protein
MKQSALHASGSVSLFMAPSSHSSPGSTTPSPQRLPSALSMASCSETQSPASPSEKPSPAASGLYFPIVPSEQEKTGVMTKTAILNIFNFLLLMPLLFLPAAES